MKNILRHIKHTQIISDPFPEHTQHEQTVGFSKTFNRLFKISTKHQPPPEINIWSAYMMGYEKAYAEIEARLEAELKRNGWQDKRQRIAEAFERALDEREAEARADAMKDV